VREAPDISGWTVYLLRCADDSLYCGVTTDMDRRLQEHNGLLPGGARYTRSRRPVTLLVALPVADRSEAARVECQIKRLPRHRKLGFLQGLLGKNPSC